MDKHAQVVSHHSSAMGQLRRLGRIRQLGCVVGGSGAAGGEALVDKQPQVVSLIHQRAGAQGSYGGWAGHVSWGGWRKWGG